MKSVRNCVEIIIILIVIGAATYSQRAVVGDWVRGWMEPELPPAVEYQEVVDAEEQEEEKVIEKETSPKPESESVPEPQPQPEPEPASDPPVEPVIPVSFNLAVPFTSQAPHGNWGEPFKESCEEASLYMVHAYYQGVGDGSIDPDTAEAELKKIAEFEKELFGYYEDTTAAQTGTLAEMFYGYGTFELIENPTVDQIKEQVAAGRPVIVPAAGRELGNPFFTAPGPIYHMLVIRGYTQDGRFITNDPGTKHGQAYLYTFDTIMNALHDWNGGNEIKEGKKVVLVVYPN